MVVRSHYSSMLVKRIEELCEKISFDLSHGSAMDEKDYRQQVGRVQGLEEAVQIASDLDAEISGE